MQVYRELRLLTARPSEAERRACHIASTAPCLPPSAIPSAAGLAMSASAMAEAQREGRLPILVGGTGLYFKALTEGLAPVPDIPAEIRSYWRGAIR